MKPPLFALLALSAGALAGPPPELPPGSTVTLPFAEVRSLLEAARPTPASAPAPPVAAVLTRADLQIDGDPAAARLTFTADISVLAAGWHVVPLLGIGQGLVAVAPAGTTLVERDGLLCLLADQPGPRSLTLTFALPATSLAPGGPPLRFELPAATVAMVRVDRSPAKSRVEILCAGRLLEGNPARLPAAGGPVEVRVVSEAPPVPTAWSTRITSLVTAQEDHLTVESRAELLGTGGDGRQATLSLPANAFAVSVTGPDLIDSPARSALRWESAGCLQRSLRIRYSLPRGMDDVSTGIVLPSIAGETHHRTILTAAPGLEATAAGAQPPDPATLPAWMATAAAAGAPLLFSGAGPFKVQIRARPRLVTETARISEASYRSRFVADGARLTEARLTISHRGPFRWTFALPPGSELIECSLAGAPVNPLIAADARLEIPLPAADDAPGETRITLSYTDRGAPFAPVEGRFSARLPATPLFIEELTWLVVLPPGYDLTAFEGNVEAAGTDRGLTFRKRLLRGEAPALEIYYRKRETNL